MGIDVNTFKDLMNTEYDDKLTVKELACVLYEGTPHLRNLAEKLAKQHGKAGALSFFGMMGDDVQNFWMHIAQQIIDHSKEWLPNNGSVCVLSRKETKRLKRLKRHPEL
jgi:hypothetical protein